ncbi:MAG: chemotaxis protein CheW, partial [Methylocystis sp.]
MTQNLIPSPGHHAGAGDVLISKDQAQETSYQQDELRLFVFEFAKMTFSLLLKYVEEVIESDKIESYPGSVPHCRGTTNHRGRVVPIFDSHGLGFERDQEEAISPYIVIINVDGLVFGLTLEKHLELIYCDTSLIKQSAQDCQLYTLGMIPYREKAMTLLAPELIAPLVRLRFNNQRIEDYKASDQL